YMNVMKNIINWVAKLCFKIAALCLMVLIALNTTEIVSRYLFKYSFVWAQEFSLLLVSWIIFLGFGKVVIDNEDIAVTFLVNKLNQRHKNWVKLLNNILLIITSAYMFYAASSLVTQ